MHSIDSWPSQASCTFAVSSKSLQWGLWLGRGRIRCLSDWEVASWRACGSPGLINISCSGPWGKSDNWTIALVICLEVDIRKAFSPTGLMLVEYSWGTYRWVRLRTCDQPRHFKTLQICTALCMTIQTCTHSYAHRDTYSPPPTKCHMKFRASLSAICQRSSQINLYARWDSPELGI